MDSDRYTIATSEGSSEYRFLGSRFIAAAMPSESMEQASAYVAQTRKRYHDATHVAWAFAGHDPAGHREHCSDDGEPSGTAGRPILQAIHRAGMLDVVVCVTRYFGGKKLGTGRLARAYGDTAVAALAQCQRKILREMCTLLLEYDYAAESAITKILRDTEGKVTASDYATRIRMTVQVPRVTAEHFQVSIQEATAGRVHCILHTSSP